MPEGYIDDWTDVPDGSTVIEDTYNEIYIIFTRDGERWLRQTGWHIGDKPIPADNERIIDFEPNCTWDQPWIWI